MPGNRFDARLQARRHQAGGHALSRHVAQRDDEPVGSDPLAEKEIAAHAARRKRERDDSSPSPPGSARGSSIALVQASCCTTGTQRTLPPPAESSVSCRGVFQASSVRSGDHSADFDLWRNIMREYSEEFLGNPEHDGDGAGADYAAEPLRSLDQARHSGGVRVYCFGLGIGALDLWCGLETVAVFDAEVFDELFANLVRVNDEGTVLRVGTILPTAHIPFTSEVVKELLATERLAPETAMRPYKARGNIVTNCSVTDRAKSNVDDFAGLSEMLQTTVASASVQEPGHAP